MILAHLHPTDMTSSQHGINPIIIHPLIYVGFREFNLKTDYNEKKGSRKKDLVKEIKSFSLSLYFT